MSRKLQYFNINGYAESIRYMLHYGGLEFEDIRYNLKDWPIENVRDYLPYGQLPAYEEDGYTINHSIAIARYIASQASLLPSDPWEQAELDAAAFNVYDLMKKTTPLIQEKDPKKLLQHKNKLYESIAFFFVRFERDLAANNGHFGKKLSWADFVLVGAIEALNFFLKDNFQRNHPSIEALIKEIHSNPGVKAYVAKRKPYLNP